MGHISFWSKLMMLIYSLQHEYHKRNILWPYQPPIQCVPGVKRPDHEADHSPPSRAEVKNAPSYTLPVSLHGTMLS